MNDLTSNQEELGKRKILVIDDCQVDLELATLMLKENGFCVITSDSPQNCMELIAAEKPDLLILDVMMPNLDGNQVLAQIRKHLSPLELPVIMVTSKFDASDVIESLKAGANDFISKPVHFEVALRRIHTQLMVVAQSKAMTHNKELEAINAMIVTLSHEINNPLAIAAGNLRSLKEKYKEEMKLQKTEDALWRIADVVKKMENILIKDSVEYINYAENTKMLKL